MGQCQVNLADLEPFQSSEQVLPVVGKGAGEDGFLTVRFVFRPEFVASRERKGTSLGRTFTQVGGGVGRLGVKGVTGVAGGGMAVGKGVGKAGFGLGKGAISGIGTLTGRNRNRSGSEAEHEPTIPEFPAVLDEDGNTSAMDIQDHQQGSGSGFNDAASTVDTLGNPSKRKSRIHNPFSKKH